MAGLQAPLSLRSADRVLRREQHIERSDPGTQSPMHRSVREELVRLIYPHASAFARILSSNEDQAQDLIQETMVQVLRSPPRSSDANALRSWTRTTVTRLFWRHERLRRRHKELQRLSKGDVPIATPDQELSARVLNALNQLPPRQRACIALFYVEDMSEPEIARLLKIRSGTVRAHLAQARQGLRQLLL